MKKTNKEKSRRRALNWWRNHPGEDNKPPRRFARYKRNAINRDLVFSLSKDEFMSFWQKPCYYCGDVIETVGIDRVDNTMGYMFSNVVSCCGRCNKMKMVMSEFDFINQCKKIAKIH